MPVSLSVSRVRDEIYKISGMLPDSTVNPSNRLLGKQFHHAFSCLFGTIPEFHWRSAISQAESNLDSWIEVLTNHVYLRLIGPWLTSEQSRLQDAGSEVIMFWQACQAMCVWVGQLLWTGREKGQDILLSLSPEEPLNVEFRQPDWTDSVRLIGMADLIIQIPDKPAWCVVELKLGKGCPEADLAQACLYHWILSQKLTQSPGTLALVRFNPEKEELLFTESRILEARQRLIRLVGKLAGVLPEDQRHIKDAPLEPRPRPPMAPHKESFENLIRIFREYNTEIIANGDPIVGPAFVRYPVSLGQGVRITAAQKVAMEVQHRMELDAPPYVHICDGNVMVDIQRQDRQTVHFDEVRNQLMAGPPAHGSPYVVLGVDLNNQLQCANLSEPDNVHILVAGTTASGKSEWLRCALAGLILTNSPDTLRLVLIDPKRNAFNELKDSSFLLSPDALIYPDEQSCVDVLDQLVTEMDQRYRLLQDAGVDTRDQYIDQTSQIMPRIVCVCDEYLDLINRDKAERKELENRIFRLGAKARSAGIHLIIATQQPNRQTIKGALDTNLPARVGFKMGKGIESNMLLGQKGAENLLGRGDMLFKDIGDPVRLQAPLLSPRHRKEIFESSGFTHG